MPEQPPGTVSIPKDLALVPLDELQELKTAAEAEFDLLENAEVTPDNVDRALRLTDDLDRVKDEIKVKQQREAAETKRKQEALASTMKGLGDKVHDRPADEGKDGAYEGDDQSVVTKFSADQIEQIVAAAAQGFGTVLVADRGRGAGAELARRLPGLAEANRHVPEAKPPEQRLVVTASVDVPGRSQGDQLEFEDLVDAYHKRARVMPVVDTGIVAGPTIATIRQEFEHTVDERTSLGVMDELFRYLQTPRDAEALLAGGGWCAPSEIRYEFFNVACTDGLVDLPTFGVSRGGIRFPTSPSLADAQLSPFVSAFSNTSNPWLWTETDDQAAVTGTSPVKPCIRVPCPSFTERRLECYGICLTAGNLADDAYPEATSNFLRLLMAAHDHAINARLLATMQGLSSVATTLTGGTDNAFNCIVGGLSLAAADYRARYGMCADDILEVVIPYWVLDAIQADLAWRLGDPGFLSITKAQIRGYMADRNIRVQFVNDWQVRGAGQFGNASAMTAWPTTVTAMMYAAGTFLKGNGLTLDLGVVRDSTLNAINDHTAAWSEECHLIARVGHESRQYTITFNVGGGQGSSAGSPPGL